MKKSALEKKRSKLQKKIAKKLRAPRGFYFSYRPRYDEGFMESVFIQIHNSKNRQVIGHVELRHYHNSAYETHSNLEQEYWNKGLGSLMYAKAIAWGLKKKLRVQSSGCGSDMAIRVWNGKFLRNFFKIREDNGTHYTKYNYKFK